MEENPVEKNEREWKETFEMLESGEEVILSELSFGKVVSIKKELFDNMVKEINDYRIMAASIDETDVDLIVIQE